MELSNPLAGHFDRRSYVCDSWDLRITFRCVEEDLEAHETLLFEDACGLPEKGEFVAAFVKNRADHWNDRNPLEPIQYHHPIERDQDKPWILRHRHEHRGATLYDEDEAVIWLIAYGWHASGDDNDFFRWVIPKANAGDLWATARDYEALEDDRAERAEEVIPDQARELLEAARNSSGPVQARLDAGFGVVMNVEILEQLEEVYLVFEVGSVSQSALETLLVAVDPDIDRSQWEERWHPANAWEGRTLKPGQEVCLHRLKDHGTSA